LFLTVNQRINVVRGEFESVAVRDRVRRTCFHAIATKNASRIINIVDRSVAFARRNAMGIGIFRGFDVNAIRGAGRGAQKTADTFFQAIFVTMQDMNAAITRLKVYRLFRITLRHALPEHSPESNAKPVEHGPESGEDFANRGCHGMSLANEDRAGKPEVFKRLARVSP